MQTTDSSSRTTLTLTLKKWPKEYFFQLPLVAWVMCEKRSQQFSTLLFIDSPLWCLQILNYGCVKSRWWLMNDSFMLSLVQIKWIFFLRFYSISKVLLNISVRRWLKMIVLCQLAVNAHQLQPLSMPYNWHQFAYEIPYREQSTLFSRRLKEKRKRNRNLSSKLKPNQLLTLALCSVFHSFY